MEPKLRTAFFMNVDIISDAETEVKVVFYVIIVVLNSTHTNQVVDEQSGAKCDGKECKN